MFDLARKRRAAMKSRITALATAMAVGCAVTASYADDPAREDAMLSHAKVSMNQAITVAEEQGSGQAIDANYIPKSGTMGTYDVKVLSMDGKKLLDFNINPENGRVLKATRASVEKVFTRIKPADLQAAQTPLKGAIKTAEAQTGGKAVMADTDRHVDTVRYTVKVAMADGTTKTIKVNGADGKLASSN
jgi:uncharacterized membrane protein YkoI